MRRCGFKSQIANHKLQIDERGYILITLMLFVALLSIAALAVLPQLKQQVLRDREEEMRHRGTAYMRAIQRYYKKNGRYPARIEELESTNNIRFLRKRYKDPMSVDPETHKEKDFKLLRMGDKELSVLGTGGLGIGLGGNPAGQFPGVGPAPPQGPGQAGLPGQIAAGIQTAFNRQPGGISQTGGAQPGGDSSAPPGSDNSTPSQGDTGTGEANQANTANQVTPAPSGSGPLGANPAGGNNPLTLGGGPILGVTSTNKDKSIREFGDKIKHYNEWLFVYDPTADRGGLIQGPVVPNSLGGQTGTPAGTLATQSQGGASSNQLQKPPQPQAPPNQQEPPEEQ